MKRAEVILYAEDGWNSAKIISVVELKQSIKEYAFILHDSDLNEDGQPKKPHYHIYLGFGTTNVQPAHIAKWFEIQPQFVQKIKTNKYLLLKYHLHNNNPDKAQYSLDQLTASFDVQKFFASKEQQTNLEAILKQCADGTITRANYHKYIDPVTYSKNQTSIVRAWEYKDHSEYLALQNNRNMTVIYVYGPAGTGKTTVCKLYAQQLEMSIYTSASGKDPFSNYEGEDVVILDDLRPHNPFKYEDLLKLLDPHHASLVDSRYHNKLPRCSICFITTVLSTEEFLAPYFLTSIDNELQFYRRIQEIWIVSKTELTIQKFDQNEKRFVTDKTIPNPVLSWLETQKKEVPAVDSLSILESINTKYSPKKDE